MQTFTFVCGKCGAEHIALFKGSMSELEKHREASGYQDISTHIHSMSISWESVAMLVCGECLAEYKALLRRCDDEKEEFFKKGRINKPKFRDITRKGVIGSQPRQQIRGEV